MVLSHTLPEDSVLRRHALTERQRVLGLPPTDSVLQRHYAQLQEMDLGPAASAPPRPAAPRPVSATPAAAPAPAVRAPAAPANGGGGFFAWLKRLLGA